MKNLVTHSLSFLTSVIFCAGAFSQPALVVDVDPITPGIQVAYTVAAGSGAFPVDLYMVHDGALVFDSYGFALEFDDGATGALALAGPQAFDPTGLGIAAAAASPAPVDVFAAPPGGAPIIAGAALAPPAPPYIPAGIGPGGAFAGTDGGILVTEPATFFPGGLPPAGTAVLLSTTMFTPVAAGVSDIAPIGIFPLLAVVAPGTPAFLAVVPPPGPAPFPAVGEFYLTAAGVVAPAAPVAPWPAGINPGTVTVTPPLSVELISFTATIDEQLAQLSWSTASETSNLGFEVQMMSPQSEAFEPVGFVDGQGDSSKQTDYTSTVQLASAGTYTFRLKQIDIDGTTSYSEQIEILVELPGSHSVSEVFPNPFDEQARFTLSVAATQHVDVLLYDAAGRQVRDLYSGQAQAQAPVVISVDGSQLPAGIYFVRVEGEVFSETLKLAKTR